jgi:transposase
LARNDPSTRNQEEGAIERKELSAEERTELLKRRAKGESRPKLAAAYNISIDRVKTLTKHILPPPGGWPRPSKLTDVQKKEILDLLPIKTFPEIAEMYGVSTGVIVYYYRSHVRSKNGRERKRTSKLTDKQKKEILDLVPLKTFLEIAEMYNVSVHTISYYLLQARPEGGWAQRPAPRSKLNAEDKVAVRELRYSGESLKTIAELYGVSQPAIHRIVRDIEVPIAKWRPTGKLTEEQKEEAVARRLAGEELATIAASYGVSIPNISKLIRRVKLLEAGALPAHKRKEEETVEVTSPQYPTEDDAAQ